jgi:hypothetical protein
LQPAEWLRLWGGMHGRIIRHDQQMRNTDLTMINSEVVGNSEMKSHKAQEGGLWKNWHCIPNGVITPCIPPSMHRNHGNITSLPIMPCHPANAMPIPHHPTAQSHKHKQKKPAGLSIKPEAIVTIIQCLLEKKFPIPRAYAAPHEIARPNAPRKNTAGNAVVIRERKKKRLRKAIIPDQAQRETLRGQISLPRAIQISSAAVKKGMIKSAGNQSDEGEKSDGGSFPIEQRR